MRVTTAQAVESERKRVAREYRRLGYRVIDRSAPEAMPDFLKDFRPSLVAEREDDRVVVEVRTARSLKGANEFVELASRIEALPGWRLELVTVRPIDPLPDPRIGRARFRELMGDTRFAADGLADVQAVYLASVIETLVTDLARRRGVGTLNGSTESLVHELAFRDIIDDDRRTDILGALDLGRRVLREPKEARRLSASSSKHLTALCEHLYAMLAKEHMA